MIIDEDLAKAIIFDELEHSVTVDGYERSEGFIITRIPGKITWQTFTRLVDQPEAHDRILLRLHGCPFANPKLTNPIKVLKGDRVNITYHLAWSGGGGGNGRGVHVPGGLRLVPSRSDWDKITISLSC